MPTNSQIEATGSLTVEGKAAIRQNALRHGLCSGMPVMDDESDDDVQQLLAAFLEENQPIGVNEEVLVYKLAEHFFFQKRAGSRLTEQLDWADQGDAEASRIGLMLRNHTTADRARALADLRKLEKERKLQEIGFVSQEPEEPPAETPAEPQASPAGPPKVGPLVATQPGEAQIPVEHTVHRSDYCGAVRVNAEGPCALEEIDRAGIVATAANSSFNQRVIEAARRPLLEGGREVRC